MENNTKDNQYLSGKQEMDENYENLPETTKDMLAELDRPIMEVSDEEVMSIMKRVEELKSKEK